MNQRYIWQLWVALVCLFIMGMSVSAYSDTYNFFFKKGKKQESQKQSSEEEEEGGDGEESKPQVANSPAPTAAQGGQAVTANGKSPIVINNYNQNNNGVPSPKPDIAQASEPSLPEKLSNQLHTFLTRPERERSPWKLTLAVPVINGNRTYTYYNGQTETTGSYRSTHWGALVGLGYNFSQGLAANLYGGAGLDYKWMAGLDLELIPFRIPVSETLNILELGFIVGGSTLAAAPGNIGSLHGGARISVNPSNQFGLTGSVRGNLGMWIAEVGLTTRI